MLIDYSNNILDFIGSRIPVAALFYLQIYQVLVRGPCVEGEPPRFSFSRERERERENMHKSHQI